MRLFIAIEIPDDLKKTLGALRLDIPVARRVPDGQIHLTLVFLGEVDEGSTALLIDELSRISLPLFELCLSGIGCFPERRSPRVLWVGLKPESRLNALVGMVREAVLYCGIPLKDRHFAAHVTLARLKIPATREVSAFLERYENLRLQPFQVREFSLFRSLPTPQGVIHLPLSSFSLRPTLRTKVGL